MTSPIRRRTWANVVGMAVVRRRVVEMLARSAESQLDAKIWRNDMKKSVVVSEIQRECIYFRGQTNRGKTLSQVNRFSSLGIAYWSNLG